MINLPKPFASAFLSLLITSWHCCPANQVPPPSPNTHGSLKTKRKAQPKTLDAPPSQGHDSGRDRDAHRAVP